MQAVSLPVLLWLSACSTALAAPAPSPSPSPSPAASPDEAASRGGDRLHANLTARATDLFATLGRITHFEDFSTRYPATSKTSNLFQVRGLLPIADPKRPETGQLIRLLIPITRPLNDHDSLGDTQLFDLKTFDTGWGLIGVGPVMFLPTAGSKAAGTQDRVSLPLRIELTRIKTRVSCGYTGF